MPGYNGSGTYQRFRSWEGDAAAGVKIRADFHDTEDNGFAAGLSNVICRDGQSTITANIPFNGKRITNLANPVDPQDAATKAYVDTIKTFTTGIVISGSDANGRIAFTGTGETGLTWNDMFFGVDQPNQKWIWVDKADPSDAAAINVMELTKDGTLTQTYKNDSTGGGPSHVFKRDSATPDVNDALGTISFVGKDSSGADVTYAQMYSYIAKPDNNAEGGGIVLTRMVEGTMTQAMAVTKDGVNVSQKLLVSDEARVLGLSKLEGGTWFNAAGTWNFQTGGDQHLYQYYTTGYFWRFCTSGTESGDLQYWANSAFVFNIDVAGLVSCYKGCSFDASKTFVNIEDGSNKYAQIETGHSWVYVKSSGQFYYSQGGTTVINFVGGQVEFPVVVEHTVGSYFNDDRTHYVGPGGAGQIHQFNSNFYLDYSSTDGSLCYRTSIGKALECRAEGNLHILGPTATKQTAGQWSATSDVRLKDVHGNYEHGLAEVVQINPVRFAYKTSPGDEYIGIIAQDIEAIVPEMITLTDGEIDGQPVDDLRQYDPSAFTYVLINAVKELKGLLDEANSRIEALEAR